MSHATEVSFRFAEALAEDQDGGVIVLPGELIQQEVYPVLQLFHVSISLRNLHVKGAC